MLKPGGRFFCLEFSKVALPPLAKLYDRYSFTVLPLLGRLVAGNRDAYQYLAESIRRFPPQEELAARMKSAGFDQVRYEQPVGWDRGAPFRLAALEQARVARHQQWSASDRHRSHAGALRSARPAAVALAHQRSASG